MGNPENFSPEKYEQSEQAYEQEQQKLCVDSTQRESSLDTDAEEVEEMTEGLDETGIKLLSEADLSTQEQALDAARKLWDEAKVTVTKDGTLKEGNMLKDAGFTKGQLVLLLLNGIAVDIKQNSGGFEVHLTSDDPIFQKEGITNPLKDLRYDQHEKISIGAKETPWGRRLTISSRDSYALEGAMDHEVEVPVQSSINDVMGRFASFGVRQENAQNLPNTMKREGVVSSEVRRGNVIMKKGSEDVQGQGSLEVTLLDKTGLKLVTFSVEVRAEPAKYVGVSGIPPKLMMMDLKVPKGSPVEQLLQNTSLWDRDSGTLQPMGEETFWQAMSYMATRAASGSLTKK